MDEINVSLNDFVPLIHDSRLIGGNDYNYNRCFLLDNNLIKINKYLYYSALDKKTNDLRKELITQLFLLPSFLGQTKTLIRKQSGVLLSSFPRGIFYINHIPSGLILNYHKDYSSLKSYSVNDYKEFLVIIRKILIRIKELDDNNIYQRDLNLSNILYKNDEVELIDLDGPFIKIGYNPKVRKAMYFKYLNDIIFLLQRRDKKYNYIIQYINDYMNIIDPSYECCERLVDEMERIDENAITEFKFSKEKNK